MLRAGQKAQQGCSVTASVQSGGPKGSELRAEREIAKGQVVARYPVEVIMDPGRKTKHLLRKYLAEVRLKDGTASAELVAQPDHEAMAKKPSPKSAESDVADHSGAIPLVA